MVTRSVADAVVLVTPRSFGRDAPALREELEGAVREVRYNAEGRPLRAAELCAQIGDVDGMIAGLDELSAPVFAAAPRLRVVARYGVGTSNVDLAAAARHGVVVTNTPGANAEAVAELTIGLFFALARAIPRLDRAVHAGAWPSAQGVELAGKTVGIVGLGRIGRAVARRAAALGCRVVAHDPYARPESAGSIPLLRLADLAAAADFLTLHLPLTEETAGLVSRDLLAQMHAGAYLVNTARGELIVEEDVLWALETGRLRGVALDALRQEPPPAGHPFLGRDDVILTPHSGAHTAEAAVAMGRAALDDLLAVLTGRPPCFPVIAGGVSA
jgi:phosphoglycerate dehydrogenase-like enzyme